MSRILHLTLKKWPFDLIAAGVKLEEYREVKPYWVKRFCLPKCSQLGSLELIRALNKKEAFKNDWDIVRFRNGYSKKSPVMDVEFKGIHYGIAKEEWLGYYTQNWFFCLQLGVVLSVKNWPHMPEKKILK